MDLLQLRYFQAVARHEHVSRAASELRIAQPSLSRAIARLEADLGVPLFDRRGRQVRLNRFGAGFLRRVDQALRELDSGRRELADTAGLDPGTVAVAAENLRILTDVLAEFVRQHPGIRFRLFQSSAPVMREQLDSGQIDLCLASQPLTGPELRTMDISREEVLLAVPPRHRLASRGHVDVAALAGEPFITTRAGHWPRALADSLFAAAGLRLTVACEGDDPNALRGLISAGLGVGLLPASAPRHPPSTRRLAAHRRPGLPPDPALRLAPEHLSVHRGTAVPRLLRPAPSPRHRQHLTARPQHRDSPDRADRALHELVARVGQDR